MKTVMNHSQGGWLLKMIRRTDPVINTTGIASPRIQELTEDDAIYNLSGQKVNGSYKGLVIQNGKKMMAK